MFARVVECDQHGALVGLETAARYAEMAERLIGKVSHWFGNIGVAGIELIHRLAVG